MIPPDVAWKVRFQRSFIGGAWALLLKPRLLGWEVMAENAVDRERHCFIIEYIHKVVTNAGDTGKGYYKNHQGYKGGRYMVQIERKSESVRLER